MLVAGAGAVGTRRARGLATEGAHVVLVDPARRMPRASWRPLRRGGSSSWSARSPRPTSMPPGSSWPPRRTPPSTPRWPAGARSGAPGASTAHGVRPHRGDQPARRPRRRGGLRRRARPAPGRLRARRRWPGTCRSGQVDLRRQREHAGRVVLVGSGPGDPAWSPSPGSRRWPPPTSSWPTGWATTPLLDRLPADVEVVDVGQDAQHHAVPQAEINRLLVDRALLGQRSWASAPAGRARRAAG